MKTSLVNSSKLVLNRFAEFANTLVGVSSKEVRESNSSMLDTFTPCTTNLNNLISLAYIHQPHSLVCNVNHTHNNISTRVLSQINHAHLNRVLAVQDSIMQEQLNIINQNARGITV